MALKDDKATMQPVDFANLPKDVEKALLDTETPQYKMERAKAIAEKKRESDYQAELSKEVEIEKELPGTLGSITPVYGSLKSSIVHFSHGNYGWGIAHGAMAVSDAFLLKSLAVGGVKLLSKGIARAGLKGGAEASAHIAASHGTLTQGAARLGSEQKQVHT